MTNYISSDFNFSALMSGYRDNFENNVQTFIPQLGAFDIVIPPNEFFYYDMRGTDVDCGLGNLTYRYWTVKDTPDTTGALYYGTKCGATPLSNICIIRRYIASYVELVAPPPIVFAPTDLGTSKLRFWTRPESQSWTTSARSVLLTATGAIGSKDDESGNGFHLIQPTSGLRPTRTNTGSFTCNGNALYTNSAIGAWTGDFDVWAVVRYNSMQSDYRLMEVNSDTSFGLLQLTPDKAKFSVANSTPPYGLGSLDTFSGIHVVHCSRVGTTASISIDGGTPATQTVTGSSLVDTAFYVGLAYFGTVGAYADHHEIAICSGLTSGERADMNAYFADRVTAGAYIDPVASLPNAANCLALYKRTGPFWQDTAGTVPATTTGDPVKRWDDTSGNGKHATWSSGNVPTLRSGGGIVMPTGGAQLEAPVTTGGVQTWTAYQSAIDNNTADYGWCFVAGNPATPLTGFGPSYNSTSSMAFGVAGAYQVALTDTGVLATRGLAVTGATNTGFIGATSVALGTAGAASLPSIRIGTSGGLFAFQGEIINTAVYSTYDGSPVTRADVIAYLLTE